MMTPGIWTTMSPEDDLPGALCFLHARGWQSFEVSYEHLEWVRANNAFDLSRQVIEELGIDTPQAHSYLQADVVARHDDIEVLLKDLDVCARVGVRNVVIHPGGLGIGYASSDERKALVRANVEAFSQLGNHAGELGLRIGIENSSDLFATDGRQNLGSTAEDLLELIDAIGLPNVGVTFDTSHANMQGLDIPGTVRAFGDRLYCTHISDNDGTGDHHLIPGIGRGRVIDWPAVMCAFADIGYEGIFNLEIPGARARDARLLDLNTRHALAVAEALVVMRDKASIVTERSLTSTRTNEG